MTKIPPHQSCFPFSLLSREQSLPVDLRYAAALPPTLAIAQHELATLESTPDLVGPCWCRREKLVSIRLGQRRSASVGVDPPRPAVLPWLRPAPSRREKADRAHTLVMSRGGWGPHTHDERRLWWSPNPRFSTMVRRKVQTAKCRGRRKDAEFI